MESFRVELDSPSGVHFPGQLISGRVVIHLKDQIKARAVLIHVLGKAKTSWTVWERRNRPNTTASSSINSGTQSVSIPYSAEIIYLDTQINVWQALNSDLQILPAGLHTFPFTFNLPLNCPPSFEDLTVELSVNRLNIENLWGKAKRRLVGQNLNELFYAVQEIWVLLPKEYIENLVSSMPRRFAEVIKAAGTIGFIRFYCKAKIDRLWKFDDTTQNTFTVMPHFDLNAIYYAALPIAKNVSKNIGILCFKHGRIGAKIILPKSGYVPGENVSLSIDVSNSTTKDVSRIEVALIERVTYTARRHNRLLDNTFGINHPEIQKKHEHRNVVQYNEEFKVASNSQATYNRLLAIPPVVPSFNVCAIIQVDYQFKIKVITKGTLGNSVLGEIPVLIGTIPLRQTDLLQNARNKISTANVCASIPNKNSTSNQHYLTPPESSKPQDNNIIIPPSYADSIFGHGTVEDTGDEKTHGFTPKYVYFNNLS